MQVHGVIFIDKLCVRLSLRLCLYQEDSKQSVKSCKFCQILVFIHLDTIRLYLGT